MFYKYRRYGKEGNLKKKKLVLEKLFKGKFYYINKVHNVKSCNKNCDKFY